MTATLQLSGNPLEQLRATTLAPYAALYARRLSDYGYAPSTHGGHLRCLVQSFVEEFLAERRRLGFGSRSMGYALRSFAAYVHALQITGPPHLEVMARWALPQNASDDP